MSSFERPGFADQLSIETPEQVALQFPIAGIGSRFVAVLVDHFIQAGAVIVLALIVFAVSAAQGPAGMQKLSGKWFLAGYIFVSFLLFWGYFTLFEALWQGQTPGKRMMHLRVIKDAGRQITLFEALARNLLRVVDYLPGMYLAGIITMLCNKRNKRLGDLAAGTLVVHERAEMQPLLWTGTAASSPYAPEPSAAAEPLFAADAIARLSAQDLVIIEAFFARALDLPLETRAAMAHRILGGMCATMGAAIPAGNPERALENIAQQLRSQRRRF